MCWCELPAGEGGERVKKNMKWCWSCTSAERATGHLVNLPVLVVVTPTGCTYKGAFTG